MMIKRFSVVLLGSATLLLQAACSSAPPIQAGGPPPLPSPGADGVYRPEFPVLKGGVDRFIRLTLGPDTRPSCDFSPHFAYGEVEPLPQDRLALKQVAECLNQPDTRSYDIVLIGRADARGSSDFNEQLGLQRAGRVRELLIFEGVDPARLQVGSRGEYDAKGSQPLYAHGYDRRVDLVIMGATHAPDARASL